MLKQAHDKRQQQGASRRWIILGTAILVDTLLITGYVLWLAAVKQLWQATLEDCPAVDTATRRRPSNFGNVHGTSNRDGCEQEAWTNGNSCGMLTIVERISHARQFVYSTAENCR